MKRILCILSILFLLKSVYPQSTDIDSSKGKIGETKHIGCGLELSPDQNELAMMYAKFSVLCFCLADEEKVMGIWRRELVRRISN